MKNPGQCALCRLCKRPIVWELVGGKPKPFDLDGKSHFTTCTVYRENCRKRDAARKAAKERGQGTLFEINPQPKETT